MTTFEVPEVARPIIGSIVAPEEIALIEALTSPVFSANDARVALEAGTGETWPDDAVQRLLRGAYERSVLALEDESFTRFRVATFYDRLGVFVLTQADEYLALPAQTREALDAWYFEAYAEQLGDEDLPTGDRVLTLDRTLDFLDTVDRPIWLNHCDCRTLAGHCDKPTDTCITMRGGINTLSHRGWSRPLTKDEAKAVVRKADRDGLMHTVNDSGICNCCSDCCYLFRAQQSRNRGLVWPTAEKIAAFDESGCSECGLCVERCPFGAFALDGGSVTYDAELCRGCGLCAQTCPTSSIEMEPRPLPATRI